LSNKKN